MRMPGRRSFLLCLVVLEFGCACAGAEGFRIATYNVEGYGVTSSNWPAKSPESKSQVHEHIRLINPDVLALQEIGSASALSELQVSLKALGLDLPYSECVQGADTNLHVAVLSRWPFTARHSEGNLDFLVGRRRFHVSRGFGEVEIRVNPEYAFTLITAHLKSRRAIAQENEAELRLQEAILLRQRIDARLKDDPEVNLVVLGDFNDTKDSATLHELVGKGRSKLVDTQPAEGGGDAETNPAARPESRRITWTHYYAKEDTYSRIDYLLLSPGMAHEWHRRGTYVLATPNWGVASDHRPLVAEFGAEDR